MLSFSPIVGMISIFSQRLRTPASPAAPGCGTRALRRGGRARGAPELRAAQEHGGAQLREAEERGWGSPFVAGVIHRGPKGEICRDDNPAVLRLSWMIAPSPWVEETGL